MSVFVRTTQSVKDAGEPWSEETVVNAFWSADENATIELRRRDAGYDGTGATYTRWIPETWSVWICPIDGTPKQLAAYRTQEQAQDHFARARAQLA